MWRGGGGGQTCTQSPPPPQSTAANRHGGGEGEGDKSVILPRKRRSFFGEEGGDEGGGGELSSLFCGGGATLEEAPQSAAAYSHLSPDALGGNPLRNLEEGLRRESEDDDHAALDICVEEAGGSLRRHHVYAPGEGKCSSSSPPSAPAWSTLTNKQVRKKRRLRDFFCRGGLEFRKLSAVGKASGGSRKSS